MAERTALITGITGQDGSYLAEFLLARGYRVHGLVRRSSTFSTDRIEHLYQDPHEPDARLRLHYADLGDPDSLRHVIAFCDPDEVYNLGAQSHVRVSFDLPLYTADIVGLGTLRLLEAVREHERRTGRRVRFFQASSSEMFGNAPEFPQRETTPMRPRSPYGAAKLFAHNLVVNYREAYGMHASCGILFNHESPRRGETFVTRKITRAVGRIKAGLQDKLYLGNLEARRDWGFAGDYVEAMWLMLQREEPGDYVVATGETHSVREFVEEAFGLAGLDWRDHVETDPRYLRPTEIDALCGDASKARRELGWSPKVGFRELVRMMVESDLELARRERLLRDAGAGPGEGARGAGPASRPADRWVGEERP
ncbi:MAG: GDP-mannose 4,6-dehydratase [Acidobacteria bacterium]|nr:MAG: GDP-mannose 4,6-dehydratase [Acidobacteriota bacterium]